MKVTIGNLQFNDLPKKIALITDHTVEKLYSDFVVNLLHDKEVHIFSFPAGEEFKTRKTKEDLENGMLERGFNRDSAVIGLGGGVVTDLAGFVAATYCRGIPLILVPTTLTAMADAAIGGKTGVNTPQGKNLIGSIYLPQETLIDIRFLATLPELEFRNGCAEMLKHGLIADRKYFSFLVRNASAIREPDILMHAIQRSIAIKQAIVKKDPYEKGIRRALNFGHTIGHAIEQHLNYQISHGEAVAIGMVGEGKLSLTPKENQTIKEALDRYQFSFQCDLNAETLSQAMAMDKKGVLQKPRFVLLDSIGKVKKCEGNYCESVDPQNLSQILEWLCDALRCH